jgi:hypothetical protein
MAYFSNGTEGMMYEERWCNRCHHEDDERGCPVMLAHLLYAYDLCNKKSDPGKVMLDMLIPMDAKGLYPEKCSMFVERSTQLALPVID